MEGLGHTEAGTDTEEMGRWPSTLPTPAPASLERLSRHQGPHQDEHGWPPVNTTSRPWRSAPPSPPPGTRNTGTPTHPRRSLTPVPPFFLIPLPRSTLSGALSPPLLDSPLHTLTSDHRFLITSPCCPSSPPHPPANFSEPYPSSPSPGAALGLPALPADGAPSGSGG